MANGYGCRFDAAPSMRLRSAAMDDPTATPEPELEDEAPDTPPAEPVEQPDPDSETDQSAASGTIAQAEYTRATQVAAAIRRELGLPKGATQAEVVAALQAARAQPVDEEGEEEDEDPRIVAERERRIAAELRVTSAVYGEQFTADALTVLNAARTTDDLDELMTMMAAFRDQHGTAPASPAAPAPVVEDLPGAAEQDIGLSEGDALASRPRESTPAGRRESSVVSAIRGIFAEAGAASRGPRP